MRPRPIRLAAWPVGWYHGPDHWWGQVATGWESRSLAADDLRPLARLLPGRTLWGWGSVLALSSTGDRLSVLDPAGGALTVVDVWSGAELATWTGLVTHLARIERVVPAAPEILSAGS